MGKAITIDTTLGDLIVALTEEATPLVCNEQESYRMVALILTHLLANRTATSRS
jgi:hypothetical protein